MRSTVLKSLCAFLALGVAFGFAVPVEAQIGGLNQLKGALKKGKKAVGLDDSDKKEQKASEPQKESAGESAKSVGAGESSSGGKILFSKKPIDPKNPSDLTTTFKAGDTIYGLVRAEKTWREIFKAKGKNEVQMMIRLVIAGENKTNQYVTLTKPELIDSNLLVLDVAPAIEKMTAYTSDDIRWAEAQRRMRIGPHIFTWFLGEFEPGKHAMTLKVVHYGDEYATGTFEIEGDNFKFYADLHQQITKALEQGATLPAAKKTDKEMEATMKKLCENAGWKDIVRLNIVDADWWIDRASGGDSAIVSRHMDAAVAAKDPSGDYYYCICTFHQHKLIDGSFGKLELTHTGQKRKILAKNIDK